jgi:hypothetical protein
MPKGGKRLGAGRPKGSLAQSTIERMAAEEAFKARVVNAVDRLFNSQLALAQGVTQLFRIDEVGTGKDKHREHTLVTDPDEMKRVLDEVEGEGTVDENYYYLTTKAPDNKAIDSMLDRTFGKAVTKLAGPGGEPLTLGVVMLPSRNASSLDTTTEAGDSAHST